MSKARELAELGAVYDSGALSNRNLIINGAMQVAQRSASESVSTSDGYKTLDRFQYNEMGSYTGVHTMSQDTTGSSGFTNSLKFLTTTADSSLSGTDGFSLRYKVEAQDLQRLGYGTSDAKSCTLSFYVKSNVTGTYTINIQQSDATKMLGVSYTVDAANTWERKTLTFIGNTSDVINNDNGIGIQIQWGLATGPDWTSGTLRSTWTANSNGDYHAGQTANVGSAVNNYWQITGIQLEVGTEATPFEHRSFGDELQRCERYYQVLLKYGDSSNSANGTLGATALMYNSTYMSVPLTFRTRMRAAPTVVSANSTGCFKMYRNNGNDPFDDFAAGTGRTPYSIELYNTTDMSGTAGHAGFIETVNSDATLAVDAEL
jgi:hypothetical protein